MPALDNFSLDYYSLDGPVIETGPKYATGTAVSTSASFNFVNSVESSLVRWRIIVPGLNFVPNRIILSASPSTQSVYCTLNRSASFTPEGTNYNFISESSSGSTAHSFKVYLFSGSSASGVSFISDAAFALPVIVSNATIKWEAFSV
jgi:hypothetical protein